MKKVYVIAEAGSCHDGSEVTAIRLVAAAHEAGADAVKFQYWSDSDELAARRKADKYRNIYRRYAMPAGWLSSLRNEAARLGLGFMATAYLPCDVALVARYVTHFKVSSFEQNAWDLLRAHEEFMREDLLNGRDRWLIVSQGMGADWNACGLFSPVAGQLLDRIKFLHCTSAYPAPIESLRLRRILKPEFGMEVDGFSDHSEPALTWSGALAVAAGATIIEAHLRLIDTDPENPDAPHAMTPALFAEYVRNIRLTERALGPAATGAAHPAEAEMQLYKLRS